MKKIVLLFFIFILVSCEEMPAKEITIDESRTQVEVNSKEEKLEKEEVVIQKTIPKAIIYTSNFGDIEVKVKKEKDNIIVLSNIEDIKGIKHKIEGEIISFIETDVNADGYNEFYCITSNGNLLAYSSYRNKSFGEIYIPQMPNTFYTNIKDVASWEVKSNKLHITLSNTSNEVLNTVRYTLIAGEAGYKLEAI